VVKADPTILMAFQLLQDFIGGYIGQSALAQECPFHARILGSLSDHFRFASNFLVFIPAAVYVASDSADRANFSASNLNSATAKKGLQLLHDMKQFQMEIANECPQIVEGQPENNRLFTCPAEPFLGRLLGETDVLERTVKFVRDALNGTIKPQVILYGFQTAGSDPVSVVVPEVMSYAREMSVRRAELLKSAIDCRDLQVWVGLGQNPEYLHVADIISIKARVKMYNDIQASLRGNDREAHPG